MEMNLGHLIKRFFMTEALQNVSFSTFCLNTRYKAEAGCLN